MMYFTKLLAVEEEIKVGDKVKLKDDNSIITATIDMPDYLAYHKVKLFLCSRDIQVGDKVYDTYSGLWVNVTDGNFPSNASDFWIKVIGEISPDAIWVKEGDEFDEDQVQFLGSEYPPFEGWEIITREEYNLETMYPVKTIKIKCTNCQNFH